MAFLINDGSCVYVDTKPIPWDVPGLAIDIPKDDPLPPDISFEAMETLCGMDWQSRMPVGVCVDGHLVHDGTPRIEFPGSRMAPLSVDCGRGAECPD